MSDRPRRRRRGEGGERRSPQSPEPASGRRPEPELPAGDRPAVEPARALELLRSGTLTVHGLLPWSSNYTFAASVRDGALEALAVYKPRRGERPLWDFPRGTLCQREVAAYVLSAALGWDLVPPTVLRDGPQGVGSVQLYVDFDPDAHYFNIREECAAVARRISAFDVIANNADRKSGHVLRDVHGQVWCIDHGVTFNEEDKLRTVIWDFVGEPLPDELCADLAGLQPRLAAGGELAEALGGLLSAAELEALRRRLARLLREGVFPGPRGNWPAVPWPPV